MVYFQDKEVYSEESDSEFSDVENEELNEIRQEIKENDNWDNFLDLVLYIRDNVHNFYYLNHVSAYKIYNLTIKPYKNFNSEIHKMSNGDKYWISQLMKAVSEIEDDEIYEEDIYDFYKQIENLNYFKEKKKCILYGK